MQIKLFTVPVEMVTDHNEEINLFLRSNKVVEFEKKLILNDKGAFWCFYISYIPANIKINEQKEKIDYMKVLDEKTFKIFSKLREVRKKIATEEGLSAFVVFTDAELAQISKLPEISIKNMQAIKGMSQKKIEKYGKLMLQAIKEEINETKKQPDVPDSLF